MAPPVESDPKHGVAAEEIWKARILKEKLISANWAQNWSWMLEEYVGMNKQLEDMKIMRPTSGRAMSVDNRTCKPLPNTSSRVIGWLTNRPAFQLEIYGPYIKKIPLMPQAKD